MVANVDFAQRLEGISWFVKGAGYLLGSRMSSTRDADSYCLIRKAQAGLQ